MTGASAGWEPAHPTERPEFGQARHLLDVSVAAAEVGRLGEAMSRLHEALAVLGLDSRGEPIGNALLPEELTEDRRLVGARILLSVAFTQHELVDRASAS